LRFLREQLCEFVFGDKTIFVSIRSFHQRLQTRDTDFLNAQLAIVILVKGHHSRDRFLDSPACTFATRASAATTRRLSHNRRGSRHQSKQSNRLDRSFHLLVPIELVL
jgi:hypothetical protein